jgi:hypothetical protein
VAVTVAVVIAQEQTLYQVLQIEALVAVAQDLQLLVLVVQALLLLDTQYKEKYGTLRSSR